MIRLPNGIVRLLVVGLALLYPLMAFAFEPQDTPTPALQQSIGMVALQSPLLLYDAPDFNARVIDELSWEFSTSEPKESLLFSHAMAHPVMAQEFFLSVSPQQQLGFLPVVNEVESGWVQVQVPHLMNQSVWVPPTKTTQASPNMPSRFMTWQQFMANFTKQYGFHWLQGVPHEMKSVHIQPDEASPLAKVTFVQSMRPLHVRGNWMLVELRDVAEERPIGWMRWRTEEGDLLVWPNFDKRQALYQAPSNPFNPQAIFERF